VSFGLADWKRIASSVNLDVPYAAPDRPDDPSLVCEVGTCTAC